MLVLLGFACLLVVAGWADLIVDSYLFVLLTCLRVCWFGCLDLLS